MAISDCLYVIIFLKICFDERDGECSRTWRTVYYDGEVFLEFVVCVQSERIYQSTQNPIGY